MQSNFKIKQNSSDKNLSQAISMDEAILRIKEGMRKIVDNSKTKKGAKDKYIQEIIRLLQ